MPKPKRPAALHQTAADTSAAVDAFMAALDHPCKDAIEDLRRIFLAADPSIAEGVKWSAPSFRTTEYFATLHLRSKSGVGIVFHLGAKARDGASGGVGIEDPGGLLKWLSKDRAMATFGGRADVRARSGALTAIVRQWIVQAHARR